MVEKLSAELREHQPDILHCVDETRRAIELLVPRFEVDDDAADVQSSSGDQVSFCSPRLLQSLRYYLEMIL